jgi:uncharacterized protein YpuA (DUF1002 family)
MNLRSSKMFSAFWNVDWLDCTNSLNQLGSRLWSLIFTNFAGKPIFLKINGMIIFFK